MKQIAVIFPYYSVVGNIVLSEAETKGRASDRLVLCTASSQDEGVYCPAESFTITHSGAIKALRDALIAAYPLDEATGEKA